MYFAAQIAELSGARALFLYTVHESPLPWATFAVILAALQTLSNSLKKQCPPLVSPFDSINSSVNFTARISCCAAEAPRTYRHF